MQDGDPQYTIVSSSAEYDVAAKNLAATLTEKTGVTFRYKTSTQQNSVTGKKIVLGKNPKLLLSNPSVLSNLGLLSLDMTSSIHLTAYSYDLVLDAIEKFTSLGFETYTFTDPNGAVQVLVPREVLFFVDNSAMDEVGYWVSLVKDGTAQYTIVSADEAYDVAASDLASLLTQQTGVTFRYKTSAQQSDVSGKKIVLGKDLYKIVADPSFLSYCGLLCLDRGTSIHITGFTEETVLASIEKFSKLNFSLFVSKNANEKIVVSIPDTYLFFMDNDRGYANPTPTILGRDLAEYQFVFPKDMTSTDQYLADTLRDTIGKNTGCLIKIVTDDAPMAAYEIVFGKTNRTGSQTLYASLSSGYYIIQSMDGSIYVAYDNYLVADQAVSAFHPLYLNNKQGEILLSQKPNYDSYAIEKTEGTDVRIMTSNIICAGDSWGKEYFEIGYGITWQERVGIQGVAIMTYLPDFVGLQEMQEGFTYGNALMHTELLKTVGSEYAFVTFSQMGTNTYWNPILYRKTVWQIEAQDVLYPANFDNDMHRWQWALFSKISDPSQKYILLNLHYPTSGNQTQQQAAADLVNAKIRELQALYPNVPIFVTGDFNANKSSTTFAKTVANTGLQPSFTLTTNYNSIESIDHVLVPSDQVSVLAYRVIKDHYIVLTSDHRPVFVDISLK